MSYYTDWFLANEKDAEAIASIATTEEHSFEDWPHLSLKSIGEMDLSNLWGILRGKPDNLDSATGDLLFEQDGAVYVCRVELGFIEALALVTPAKIEQLAAEWRKSEELEGWSVSDLVEVVQELAKFAGRAQREGKPVLQLSVV